MPRTTCTNHCSACGCHFHSLAAFDAHREGSYTDGRRCVEPRYSETLFVALSEDAVCSMYKTPVAPVTVWTLPVPLLGESESRRQLRQSSQRVPA